LGAPLVGVFYANCDAVNKVISGLTLLILAGVVVFALPIPGVGLPYLIGITATAITLIPSWHIPSKINFNGLSDFKLGIYLSNPLWMLILKRLGMASALEFTLVVIAISATAV
jgi:hypothetical protein